MERILDNNKLADNREFRDLLEKIIDEFSQTLLEPLENGVLAHYKHAIEFIERTHYGRMTNIIYKEVDLYSKEDRPTRKKATVRYHKGAYIIAVSKHLETEEKRMLIGHELGHILISLLDDDKLYNKTVAKYPYTKSREVTASILCFLMHLEQSKHYQSDKIKSYTYKKDQNFGLLKKILEINGTATCNVFRK